MVSLVQDLREDNPNLPTIQKQIHFFLLARLALSTALSVCTNLYSHQP